MKTPFFSIIIPTRNLNDYIILETLPALDLQSFTEFEVFIVPDFDSEMDSKLMNKYKWLQIIPSYKMKKPGDKRDYGVSKSKGTIVSFIDDDVHPTKHWLTEAYNIFNERPEIAALGGPGVLPIKGINKWERVFDAVLKTRLGSGGYEYRFTPQKEQFVDDYPAMNLMMRKDVFLKIGGFRNQYWPGEDSKLLSRLDSKYTERILYHPNVKVYHHRRNTLEGHLRQHMYYGLTRGTFFAHGDRNSTNLIYFIPAFFTLYLFSVFIVTLISAFVHFSRTTILAYTILVWLYSLAILFVMLKTYFQSKKYYIALGTGMVIPIMHLIYGLFFIYGFAKAHIKKILNE